MEIARRNGYDEGRYFANMLKDEMISHRNTSSDDIHAFEEATGYFWEYSTDVSVFFLAIFLALYIIGSVLMNKKKSNNYPVISGNYKKRNLL